MKWRQRTVLITAWEAQGFLDAFAGELGPINRSPERREFDAAVAALSAAAAAQEFERTASMSLTQEKNLRRKELLDDHVLTIVAIARKLTKTKGSVTSAIRKMRMPKRRTSDLQLVSWTRGIATAAAKYEKEYIAQQMPEDFVKQARDAAGALLRAVQARDQSRNNHVRASGNAAHQTALIRDSLKVLHGRVHARFFLMHRPDLVDAWNETKRYPRNPGAKRSRKAKP